MCYVFLSGKAFSNNELMINSIREYIKSNALPQAPTRLLVAVSGGADSVALLHILVDMGYDCIVAHCNFHLREIESDRDAKFVHKLASKLNIPFVSTDFDTTAYAQTNKLSIEMAARDLRYNWFEQMRIKYQAEAIAVAHHADDVVETFLMNITRGTGIHGLTGIKARNGFIIRPLLTVSRLEIEEYLAAKEVEFVVDSTNLEQIYTRNKFRHSVIPLLEEFNPSFRETIKETVERLSEVETLYNEQISQIKSSLITESEEGFSIDIDLLLKQNCISTILYEILSPIGFSTSTIQSLIKSLDGESGKQFFSSSHRTIKDRKSIIISPIRENQDEIFLIEKDISKINFPIKLEIEYLKNENISIKKEKQYAYVDAKLLIFPLILRRWHEGDYFIPFGMKGKKKLSDFFIDNKFTLDQKEQIWVLVSGKEIVWLVGERLDNRFCINFNSKDILKFELIN